MSELRGCLRDFGLVPLVRFAAEQRRTACLKISQTGLVGEVFIEDGRVVAAELGRERGVAALELIALAMDEADFVYTDDSPVDLEPNINANSSDIEAELEELTSRRDRRHGIPALHSVPHVAQQRDENAEHTVALSRSDLLLLLAVDGRHTTQEIISSHDPVQALQTLTRLSEAGVIQLDAPAAAPVSAQLAPPVTPVAPSATVVRTFAPPSPAPPRLRAAVPETIPTVVAPARPLTATLGVIRSIGLLLILTVVFVIALRGVVQSAHVEGQSMQPGLMEGDLLLVNRVAYMAGPPQRGDVVVFQAPNPADPELVKRIIGLPGEQVRIEQQGVVVDDLLLEEPYKTPNNVEDINGYRPEAQPVRVPDNSYFVLGDNRNVSLDSRMGWFVSADQLIGRASMIYWPPSRWGLIPQQVVAAVPQVAGVAEARPTIAATPTALVAPTPIRVITPTPLITRTPPTPPLTTSVQRTLLDGAVKDQPGWPSDPTRTAWTDGNSYRLRARQPSRFVAVAAPLDGTYADVLVTAAFHKLSGPPGGGYGIIVRDDESEARDGVNQRGRFYVAEAGDRGEVGMWRREDDHWVDILPWRPSAAVYPGGTTNELKLSVVGNRLTFLVNGSEVATVVDDTLPSGRVGVFVGGDDNEVALDRFTVQLPATTEQP